MSDETPRELTEPEMQTLEERARYFNREITVALDTVLSLCHMARRGARALTLNEKQARTVLRELNHHRDHGCGQCVPGAIVGGDHGFICVRHHIENWLDALTGAGEETP